MEFCEVGLRILVPQEDMVPLVWKKKNFRWTIYESRNTWHVGDSIDEVRRKRDVFVSIYYVLTYSQRYKVILKYTCDFKLNV